MPRSKIMTLLLAGLALGFVLAWFTLGRFTLPPGGSQDAVVLKQTEEQLAVCQSQLNALSQQTGASPGLPSEVCGMDSVIWLVRCSYDEERGGCAPSTMGLYRPNDFWFVGVDGGIAVCQEASGCTPIPRDMRGTEGYGTNYEFHGFHGPLAVFQTIDSLATAWRPFPRRLNYNVKEKRWQPCVDCALPLTEPVDWGWMVGHLEQGGDPRLGQRTELSGYTFDDGVVDIELRLVGDSPTGMWSPPWTHAEYSVVDDALVVTFHDTQLAENLREDLKQHVVSPGPVTKLWLIEDQNAHVVRLSLGLYGATSFWVTWGDVLGASALMEMHFK